jgi:integrase
VKNLTKTTGKHLVKAYKTWQVELLLPKDVRHHFLHGEDSPKNLQGKPRSKLKQSLGTDELALAEFKKKPILDGWKRLIEEARLKNAGHMIDKGDLVAKYKAKFNHSQNKVETFAEAAFEMGLDNPNVDQGSKAEREILEGLGETTGQLTPLNLYVDEFQEFIKYTPYTGAESRRFITEKFGTEFNYFEAITTEVLKGYVQRRLSGSDGNKPWSVETLKKNLGFVKSYWKYCVNHQSLKSSNPVVYEIIIPETPNTKAHRQKTRKKEANHAYSVEECWKIHDAAVKKTGKQNELLADLILLGMYTGCRLNELCSLELTDVTDDRISLPDSKTDAGERDIPIHRDIQQVIERLKQTSTDGFLFSGLTCNNEFGDRSKAIGQRYGRLKRKLGFTDKVHSFHSFRSTLATQLLNAGVPLEFAARIIGHSNPEGVKNNLTFGHYAGELTWKNKVEAMAKVKYT